MNETFAERIREAQETIDVLRKVHPANHPDATQIAEFCKVSSLVAMQLPAAARGWLSSAKNALNRRSSSGPGYPATRRGHPHLTRVGGGLVVDA